jgi:hypothetical protein
VSGPAARVVIAVIVVVHIYLGVDTIGEVREPAGTVVALAIFTVFAFTLTLPFRGRLPTRIAVLVDVAGVVIVVISDLNVPADAFHGFASWHLGAVTMLFAFLALRERFVLAWVGMFSTVLLTAVSLMGDGVTVLGVLGLVGGHLGTLLVGTLFGIGLGSTNRRIDALHREEAEYAARAAREEAVFDEQERQARYLESVAVPALEQIAATDEYSDAQREQWLALESAIRDSLRAPSLMSPSIVAAAARARQRGVAVTLLDDGGAVPLQADELDRIGEAIVRALDLAHGDVTARILPPGRGALATIVRHDADSVDFTEVR